MFSSPITDILCALGWRVIAQSTPHIWTAMRVELNPPGIHHSQFNLAHTFLRNSRTLPLRIFILRGNGRDPRNQGVDSRYFEDIIQLLNAHSGRWRHLDVQLPHALVSQLTNASSDSYSQLEALKISGYVSYANGDGMRPTAPGTLWKMRSSRPSPRRVDITGFRLRRVKINWNNTTEVTFRSLYANECLELFRQASRVVACTIINVTSGHDEDSPEPTCLVPTLLSLKTLKISFSSRISESLVMDRICAPVLTHLSVNGSGPHDYIERLIDRSTCQLLSLEIGDEGYEIVGRLDISSIARKTPRLKSLWLNNLSFNDFKVVFELLAQTSEPLADVESDLAPGCFAQLSTFGCTSSYSLPWSKIPNFFPRRDAGADAVHRPFRVLDINVTIGHDETSNFIDPETVHQLLGLVKRGGIWLRIFNRAMEKDLIEASCEYHGIAIPEGVNLIHGGMVMPVFD